MHPRWPIATPGQRIGLLGGSFNPPHAGHRAISLHALKRLELERVWWLVAPQNPLKSSAETAPYDERMAAAREIAAHPRICVSNFERRHGCAYTIETLGKLRIHHGSDRFVWLMGADAFAGLHLWKDWRAIADTVPIAVFNRPGLAHGASRSKAAIVYAEQRLPAHAAPLLADIDPPVWCFIDIPLSSESSTALRTENRLK